MSSKKDVDPKRTIDAAALEVLKRNESSEKVIETAYDRYLKQQPQCNYGDEGVCCRICIQGPCRITKKASKGICGASAHTIAARNLVRYATGGAAAHTEHATHVAHAIMEMMEGKAPDYEITDPEKLHAVARRVGLEVEGKDDKALRGELCELIVDDLTRFTGDGLIWLKTTLPEERVRKLESCDIMPSSIKGTVCDAISSTHMGMDADPVNLVFLALKTSVADFAGEHIATDISDILFGTPKPVTSEANLGVIDPEYVNLAVHGHNPLLSEMIVRAAREMKGDAEKAGAKGVKVMGICCTGNEVLMRQGVPVVTNFVSQELPIMTGALDAMVVDIQCIMPAIRAVAECFHTKIITTAANVKIPGSYHIDYSPETAMQQAREVVQVAIDSFKKRNPDRIFVPQIKNKVVAGFSMEALINLFAGVNKEKPVKALTDAIESGQLRGVAILCGCNNLKSIHDYNHLNLAKELAKNNVFMVATGCAAGAAAKDGLMSPEAVEQYAGEGLKSFINQLNEANDLKEKLPLVFHMGSCVDNSRTMDLAVAMAEAMDVPMPKLPCVCSAPEAMSEKAIAIGSWFVTLGIPTHVGTKVPVTGSQLVNGVALQIAHDVYGGYFIWEEDPFKAAEKLVEALDYRTWKHGVHKAAAEKYGTAVASSW